MKLKHDWTFACRVCGKVIGHDKPPPNLEFTRCCNEYMQRVFPESKGFNINGGTYLHTKYSDSLAVSISQIEEHKQMHPDVKIDVQGRPGFDTVRQQDKYLDTCGMIKHSQKIRKKGKTIATLQKPT